MKGGENRTADQAAGIRRENGGKDEMGSAQRYWGENSIEEPCLGEAGVEGGLFDVCHELGLQKLLSVRIPFPSLPSPVTSSRTPKSLIAVSAPCAILAGSTLPNSQHWLLKLYGMQIFVLENTVLFTVMSCWVISLEVDEEARSLNQGRTCLLFLQVVRVR